MDKSLALVEYKTVTAGITAADRMVKSAAVEILQAQTVCPGKYLVMLCGKLSAVKAAVEHGIKDFEENVIDSFILGNPHDNIFPAISGVSEVKNPEALGIIETYSAASIIVAADTAAKTAKVDLVEIRIARGMCGKGYLLMTGEVAAVEEALEAACKKTIEEGMLVSKSVIANPDKKIWEAIL
jgi:microcompartment protein CcmL/EutN